MKHTTSAKNAQNTHSSGGKQGQVALACVRLAWSQTIPASRPPLRERPPSATDKSKGPANHGPARMQVFSHISCGRRLQLRC